VQCPRPGNLVVEVANPQKDIQARGNCHQSICHIAETRSDSLLGKSRFHFVPQVAHLKLSAVPSPSRVTPSLCISSCGVIRRKRATKSVQLLQGAMSFSLASFA
jgi:hypothetical protein